MLTPLKLMPIGTRFHIQRAMLSIAQPIPMQSYSNYSKRPSTTPKTALKSPDHYDIVITGGGVTATTLALALSKSYFLRDKRILILAPGAPHEGCSMISHRRNKITAINTNAVDILKFVGAWDHIKKVGAMPIRKMKIWRNLNAPAINFYNERVPSFIEYIVERNAILDAIYAQLEKKEVFPNITTRYHCLLDWLYLPQETGTGRSMIGLQDGSILTSELLIGTDGFDRVVRSTMGVDVFAVCHGRVAVTAKLEVADAGDNTIFWERFTDIGSITLLPLSENVSSLIWNVSSQNAKKLIAMKEENFVNELNKSFGVGQSRKLGFIEAFLKVNYDIPATPRDKPPKIVAVLDDSRTSQRSEFSHASFYVRPGVALAGDAAHRVYPLAGQSINLAFSDIRYLVQAIASSTKNYVGLGDVEFLHKYESLSMAKNLPVVMATHGIKGFYATTYSPLMLLRALPLKTVEIYNRLKKYIKKRFMR